MEEAMRKAEFEQKYLGKKVQIELFDGHVFSGFLQKTGDERFKNNPDLYLRRGYYCLIETLESQYNVDFIIFRFSHVHKIKFV